MNPKRITLTFDNGPDTAVTPLVLDELDRTGLPATFLAVGERLEDNDARATLRRASDAGHRIGNHTYSHPRPLGALDPAAAVREIARTDELLGDLLDADRLFRPSAGGGRLAPGVFSEAVVEHLRSHGHTVLLWNVVCEDWRRPDGSWVELAFERMAAVDWALLVLHDIAGGAMSHLGRFLDEVEARGIDVVAEFPDELVPIRGGEIRHSVDHLVA